VVVFSIGFWETKQVEKFACIREEGDDGFGKSWVDTKGNG
jgi:hypothetical protein